MNAQKEFLPESLCHLLKTMFVEANCELKVVSVAQAIVQDIRPRTVIAPLQIGLGIQMHHNFKSKFVVETLNKLGFCSSYPEVKKFKFCAAATADDIRVNPGQVIIKIRTILS